jgi:uncharacterized membrane protein/thiol-disulfide isomerase/thioredoxin
MFLNNFLGKTSSHNTSLVACQLINSLKLPVTKTTIVDTLEAHPSFPSLYSISDSLRKWKVDNVAIEIEPERLDELPVPFIAHLKKGSGYFLTVTKVRDNTIDYLSDAGKQKQKSRDEFLGEWSNVILFAEPSAESGEKEFFKKRKKERINNFKIPFIFLGNVAFILGFILTNLDSSGWVWPGFMLLIKFSGALVTSLLLWFEIDKSNPVLKQVCGAGGSVKNANCSAVLESKQAKIFDWLSWSEIGFFYFAGGFLLLLLNGNYSFGFLAWLNLFAMPYIVFSLFYQWKIAKQWCPLCLTVQALLLLEFIASFIGHWRNTSLNLSDILSEGLLLTTFISFLLPIFFWTFTKEFLIKTQRAEQLRKELSRFKYNPELFQSILPKQKAITASPEGLGIILGNPNANHTIIKVCNPYCGPCAKAHPIIDDLLESNGDVNVQIIFTAANDEGDMKSKPVKHLMALYEKKDKNLIQRALNDWYRSDEKDYEAFAGKYQLNGELQEQGHRLENMDSWCRKTGISFTPTFFVNGHQLPEVYNVEDLKDLL